MQCFSRSPSFQTNGFNVCPKSPNEAVEGEADHWKQFCQIGEKQRQGAFVLSRLKTLCVNGLALESQSNMFDMAEFDVSKLYNSARNYRKISKGSDHWLASEFLLPEEVLSPSTNSTECGPERDAAQYPIGSSLSRSIMIRLIKAPVLWWLRPRELWL